MLAPMIVLLLGVSGVLSGQILSYEEKQHSRSEGGVPGNNVTGNWSWVDNQGQQRHIWYVADSEGFRAFGDLVPGDAQQPLLKIGTPVLFGNAAASKLDSDNTAKLSLERSGKASLSLGTPVIGGHVRTSDSDTLPMQLAGASPSIVNQVDESQIKLTLEPSHQPVTSSPLTATPPNIVVVSASPLSVPELITANKPSPQQVTQKPATILFPTTKPLQGTLIESINGQMEKISSEQNIKEQAKINSLVNEVASEILLKALASPSAQKEMKLERSPQNLQGNNIPLEILLPEPAEGSDFVLIDRLRLPNAPKTKVGSRRIVPQPVHVKSPSTKVIKGLHTSGTGGRRVPQNIAELAPLGIHLFNLVPFRGNGKSIGNNRRPVPKPSLVTGAPNLENFYRPATLALTTPSPRRLPNPMRDIDYQYYDYNYYDYYDYPAYDTGSSRGGPLKTETTENSKSSGTKESEENDTSSAELDFEDSLDSDENEED